MYLGRFYKTELDFILTQLGKRYLIVIGNTTCVCVESAVRDALFSDHSPVVLENCTAEPIGIHLPRNTTKRRFMLLNKHNLVGLQVQMNSLEHLNNIERPITETFDS